LITHRFSLVIVFQEIIMARRWYVKPLFIVVILALLWAAFALVIRPWYTNWGATPAEISQPMAGDDLVAQPARSTTRAITIRAPAEKIWPWLAQFGQAEGGMYSYVVIEKAIGCDMPNADQIVPEWQTVSVGSEVRMCQEGYGPAPYLVAAVEPGQTLVMGHHPQGRSDTWGDSWALVISPIDANTSRLYLRTRTTLTGVMWDVIDPGVFIMEYGMLHGIKERAEAGG
jgi:hypothetical protein